MSNLVITIGRQCGSRGKTIGKMVAEALGVKCYDKELLTEAAKHSGLCEELFETHDEKPTNSFLYSLVMDTYSLGYTTSAYMDMPINHKIFLAQYCKNHRRRSGDGRCDRRSTYAAWRCIACFGNNRCYAGCRDKLYHIAAAFRRAEQTGAASAAGNKTIF